MAKYSKLMESLRGMEPNVCSCAADAIEDMQTRVAEAEDTNNALRVRLGSELHEPVTTVEDRYNADGKSCHITDDLPAGMKLYARPVHAEPVNARLLRLIKKARITIFDGLETPCELEHPASIDDRMLVTEIDSAIADAEAQQAGPVRLTDAEMEAERDKQEPVVWEGAERWEPLAMFLCADENGSDSEQAEKVDEAIREALGDAYDCLRVCNAWSYGTMGTYDFSQVAEDPDRVADIRNAAAAALGFNVES